MSAPISPDDWPRVSALLDALLDASPAAREGLLTELSGGDVARRAELERLLAECDRSDPLLDRPAAERFAEIIREKPARFPDALASRYRLTRELGQGGMATVFLARDLRHDRDVAVKVMRPELSLGRERFLREIAIAARLRHPHIVPLFDSGDADGVLYYVMPYEEGHSLRERLGREAPLPFDEAVDILRDICEALAYAHANGIVHRDIKPDNVLLSGRQAVVTDFGVARAITEATARSALITGGVAIGTPAYMAPEQAAADPAVDHRADIYALGVVAYELLTGDPPFSGDTPQVLSAHLTVPPPPIRVSRPDVPPALGAVVMKCLEKRVADRWQKASDLREALDAALKPGAVVSPSATAPAANWGQTPALPPGTPARVRRSLARRWAPASLVVIAGVIALGALREWLSPDPAPPSIPLLAIGILPVTAATPAGELDWLARGLETQLSSQLTNVDGLELRPIETIAASTSRLGSLDSVAVVHQVDYFVRASLSHGVADSVVASLELIEGGLRSVRAGNVSVPVRAPGAVQLLGRNAAEQLRPMLGSRIRERQLEAGTRNRLALQHRRRADQYRLLVVQRFGQRDLAGAERALDSAMALLVRSQRLDPEWPAPSLARASLAPLRVLWLVRPGDVDYAAIRRVFSASIALVDTVLSRHPGDAVALAERGRLRLRSAVMGHARLQDAAPLADSARRDLEAALAADSTLVRAAADLSELLHAQERFSEGALYAERAYRMDAFLEDASAIIYRLAMSHLEMENDAAALQWCGEGVRRFPENPSHYGCALEVMAWGNGVANADSAWKYFRALASRIGAWNVSARATYQAAVAGILARSAGVPADSARAVLARARAELDAAPGSSAALRDAAEALEAAVLYRLGDRGAADRLFSQVRQRDSVRATRLALRRPLRHYVGRPRDPGP